MKDRIYITWLKRQHVGCVSEGTSSYHPQFRVITVTLYKAIPSLHLPPEAPTSLQPATHIFPTSRSLESNRSHNKTPEHQPPPSNPNNADNPSTRQQRRVAIVSVRERATARGAA